MFRVYLYTLNIFILKARKLSNFRLLLSLLRIRNYVVANYNPLKRRVLVFSTFLILASVFWFWRALDDITIAEIKYPVSFLNLPKNKILTNNPPDHIILKVRGDGYSILNNKFTPPHIKFDVNNFSLYYQSVDSMSVYLVSRLARESLKENLNDGNNVLEILSISPDTIFFNFAKTKSKNVPVVASFTEQHNMFAQQHMQNGDVKIIPDSITIVGAAGLIDSIRNVYTKRIHLSNLKDTFTVSSSIEKISDTKFSEDEVEVQIPVDRFTEAEFNIPLLSKHTPDTVNLVLFPRTVKINYKVTLSYYNSVSGADFRPYVDYYDVDTSKTSDNPKLKVNLDSVPEFTHAIKIYPSFVDYLIEFNNAKSRNNRRDR